MAVNTLHTEKIFQEIDLLIEKWCKQTGLKKTNLFDSGIITNAGYNKAIEKQSLRLITLIEIADFFKKDYRQFFCDEKNEWVLNDPEPGNDVAVLIERLSRLEKSVSNLERKSKA